MKIARVFPRITKATPTDDLCFHDIPPRLILPEIDEVHVSVTFTYDKAKGEELAEDWRMVGVPVKIGGPAYGQPAGEFTPGMYMKKGYTITSRGCPNHCWFCRVPKTQGKHMELQIKDGWIIQDDNFLACSKEHIKAVGKMLERQKEKPKFTGGLEAKILEPWHVEFFHQVKPAEMYFAYDTPDDYEPLLQAGKMLREAGFTLKSRKNYCYCLVGYPGDTFEKAEKRLKDTLQAGFIPFAMLYKNEIGEEDSTWRKFQRQWARHIIVISNNKEYFV